MISEETSPRLLTSVRNGEDAGVFMLEEGITIVQSVDFFPPIVNDPLTFGKISAANALSDIYAMNAQPQTALNIIAFPCNIEKEIIGSILQGGQEKVREAGAIVVGGHSIDDEELKYGMCVLGTVNPELMWRIDKARIGDILILTKPIGTGILSTALKAEFVDESEIKDAISSMCELNKRSREVLARYRVHACTDVTGFGLIGHLKEMCTASGIGAVISLSKIPFFEKTLEMAEMGMIPAGQKRNKDFASNIVATKGNIEPLILECLFDPQTSGGLLACVHPDDAPGALKELRNEASPNAEEIGYLISEKDVKIVVEP